MRIYIDCMPCFIRQSLEAVRYATEDTSIHEQVVRAVLNLAGTLDMHQSPPAIGQLIHRWVRNLSGNKDPYYAVKQQFNNAALAMYPRMRQLIAEAADPFQTAIRLAIAGNIIDFGVFGSIHKADLDKTINECLTVQFDTTDSDAFCAAVRDANSILYLADNTGEIVFDRLLIEQLPMEKITVAVKGSPTINDATMEDAKAVGLTAIVNVIDNGSDAPGTLLNDCSPAFRSHFENADLIIAKGQGNYETLSEVNRPIFFLLKVKCPVIAGHLGCEIGQMIFQHSAAFKGQKENAKT